MPQNMSPVTDDRNNDSDDNNASVITIDGTNNTTSDNNTISNHHSLETHELTDFARHSTSQRGHNATVDRCVRLATLWTVMKGTPLHTHTHTHTNTGAGNVHHAARTDDIGGLEGRHEQVVLALQP
jgi:hypothetical protein